ncbi:MAG: hypothetical protein M3021_03780 [Actinomycetota bacterium]|nr:hypothetical protein [Actinomycetota bacterium]
MLRTSRTRRGLIGTLATLLLLAGLGGVAAAKLTGSITPVSESHAGATLLAQSMMANPQQLINGRFAALPPDGHPNAISTEPLAVFRATAAATRS